ncbi:MAG: VanW family protein [Leptospiraceae bacterium]|nr:VanW family protein [Leptospiraceae bacterium]
MFSVLRHYLLLVVFFLRGRRFRLARHRLGPLPSDWQIVFEEKQPIHATEYAEGKIANMRRAIAEIEGLVMPPGSWFSWWHFVPRPGAHNGFALGRTLLRGRLTAGYGGGLCQLSGIIYLAALKLGMTVHERHAHSRDIYREEERYTPLGADAAIVFGYKNLVFQNGTDYTFVWNFHVEQNALILRISARQKFTPTQIIFKAEPTVSDGRVAITTLRHRGEVTETICRSFYLREIHDEKI